MAEEKVLSTDEAKEKLAELEKHMPKASDEVVYKFGHFLAGRLNNPEIVPQGFVMACELALYDLQQGVDGFSNKPIQSSLVGYPPMIYGLLRMEIPEIAKAVFPEDFAAEVKTMFDEVNAAMREKE